METKILNTKQSSLHEMQIPKYSTKLRREKWTLEVPSTCNFRSTESLLDFQFFGQNYVYQNVSPEKKYKNK